MKKYFTLLAAVSFILPVSAATLRVNNTPGSGAQYTTFADAEQAAADGDVIIVDGSNKSYDKITISKKITVKGPGFFLDANNNVGEGAMPATFNEVTIVAEGATVTGLYVDGDIYLQNNNIVVNRCYASNIYHSKSYSYSQEAISNCIIHQNFIRYSIKGDSYSKAATLFQVTNNIFSDPSNACIYNLDKARICHNTIVPRYGSKVGKLSNCVIENNICPLSTPEILTRATH